MIKKSRGASKRALWRLMVPMTRGRIVLLKSFYVMSLKKASYIPAGQTRSFLDNTRENRNLH
jgi:hypothetical protein